MSDANNIGRQSRRREATRKRLLAAALVVFEREGLAEATIASITEEADVGFGTFYLYFETKKALFESVVREGFAELAEKLEETDRRAEAESVDWRDRIRRYVTTYYEFAAAHRALYRVMFAGREAGIGLGRGLREPFIHQLHQWIHVAQRHGQKFADNEFEAVAVGLVAALNRSGVWWMQQQEAGHSGAPSLTDIITTMSRFVIAVLEGPHTTSE
jgi:AcrR family transcriptional regulator